MLADREGVRGTRRAVYVEAVVLREESPVQGDVRDGRRVRVPQGMLAQFAERQWAGRLPLPGACLLPGLSIRTYADLLCCYRALEQLALTRRDERGDGIDLSQPEEEQHRGALGVPPGV